MKERAGGEWQFYDAENDWANSEFSQFRLRKGFYGYSLIKRPSHIRTNPSFSGCLSDRPDQFFDLLKIRTSEYQEFFFF